MTGALDGPHAQEGLLTGTSVFWLLCGSGTEVLAMAVIGAIIGCGVGPGLGCMVDGSWLMPVAGSKEPAFVKV